jgi:hypothetical protein
MRHDDAAHRREDFAIAMVAGTAIVYGIFLVVAAVLFAARCWAALVHLARF